jgi:hypothetical protein
VGRLIEAVLGAGLQAYVCTSHADGRLLRKILKDLYDGPHQPRVIVSKFLAQRHSVRPVKSRFPVLLDLLEVSHPVVFNCLVDLHFVEEILVCGNKQAGLEKNRVKKKRPAQWVFFVFFIYLPRRESF